MMAFSRVTFDLAESVIRGAAAKNIKIAGAESCTGGLVAAALTNISSSSSVFEFCIVSYAEDTKNAILKVPVPLIKKHGAVSAEVACAMAEGVRKIYPLDMVFSITGVAGPGGGTELKPVGTVFIALSSSDKKIEVIKKAFSGNRKEVRIQTVNFVLMMLLKRLNRM